MQTNIPFDDNDLSLLGDAVTVTLTYTFMMLSSELSYYVLIFLKGSRRIK